MSQWLCGHRVLKGLPVYVPAETMRQLALGLLKDRISGIVEDPYNVRFILVCCSKGGVPSLECFHPGDRMDNQTALMASSSQGCDSAWEYAGLIECLVAHAVQYSQEAVYNEEGQLVSMEERTVLDPVFLANSLDVLRKERRWNECEIEELLRVAPVRGIGDVNLVNVQKRVAVLRWQSLLGAKVKRSGVDDLVIPRVVAGDKPPEYSEEPTLQESLATLSARCEQLRSAIANSKQKG